jgi:hypothetical protein
MLYGGKNTMKMMEAIDDVIAEEDRAASKKAIDEILKESRPCERGPLSGMTGAELIGMERLTQALSTRNRGRCWK